MGVEESLVVEGGPSWDLLRYALMVIDSETVATSMYIQRDDRHYVVNTCVCDAAAGRIETFVGYARTTEDLHVNQSERPKTHTCMH